MVASRKSAGRGGENGRAVRQADQEASAPDRHTRTKEVLHALLLGGAVAGMFVAPGIAPVVDILSGDAAQRRRTKQAIRRLEEKGYIRRKWDGSYERVSLTKAGRRRAQRARVDMLAIPTPKSWDGRWRLIMFDFPTKAGGSRILFRQKLQSLGFYQLQRSVYVYPYPCEKEVALLGEYTDLGDCVKILETEDLGEDEPACRNAFGLK